MEKRYALPLTLFLVLAAFGALLVTDGGDLGLGSDSGSDEASDVSPTPDPQADGEASDGTEASHPSSSERTVESLVRASDPSSGQAATIRDRLAPVTKASTGEVEPLQVPTTLSLHAATLAHPSSTEEDIRYVESLQPLPPELDRALGHVVAAHGLATEITGDQAPPGASAVAAVTMAEAFDTAMPTLEQYIDHPVWDRGEPEQPDEPAEYRLQTPSLEVALLDLYSALGLPEETVEALAPQAEAAAQQLPEPYRESLAKIVTAKAAVQRAAADAALTAAADDEDDPTTLVTRDRQLEGSPLDRLEEGQGQLRAALEETEGVLGASTPQATHEAGPWSGPLGLIVVGSPGEDRFDGNLTGELLVREPVRANLDGARSTAGETRVSSEDANIQLGPVSLDTGTDAEAAVDAENDTLVPELGWHMLVLDPGGDDVYHNNAGGIRAGGVAVTVDADTEEGPTSGAKTMLLRDGELCAPSTGFCEPRTEQSVSAGQLLAGTRVTSLETGEQAAVGVPLTATVLDLGGEDTYEDTGSVIQGAAHGLATGTLVDTDGNDTYNATTVAQGAGEHYGAGMLVDARGNDTYRAEKRAQGWVQLPDGRVGYDQPRHANPFVSFDGDENNTLRLLRVSEGSLTDVGGNDTYELDDLLQGQGIVDLPTDTFRQQIRWWAESNERLSARLVDVGGGENMSTPEVDMLDGTTQPVRSSKVNASGWQALEYWQTRVIPEPGATGFGEEYDDDHVRLKTALNAKSEGTPDPIQSDAIRVGAFEIDHKEWQNTVQRHEFLASNFLNFIDSPPLLLFGQPGRVQDTPAITVTFGGDTTYEGDIASIHFEFQSFGQSIADTARVLLDLEGDDRYVGGNNTIAHAGRPGVAMVVDREGDDVMEAGNRSIAYSAMPESTSVVLALDGQLTARSDGESQAHAAYRNPEGLSDREFTFPPFATATGQQPPLALLSGVATDTTSPEAGLDLEAGNRSQAYSEGYGVAAIVATHEADRLHTDGWGQGFHDSQQLIHRFCDSPAVQTQAQGESVSSGAVNSQLESVNPWIGGFGLVLDPAGDDTYTSKGQVGMGDVFSEVSSCPDQQIEPTHLHVLGLGALVDARGGDRYDLTELPPRPDILGERTCGGTNLSECQPRDDRAWMTLEEDSVAGQTAYVVYEGPGPMGIGVDNVRNAHHLGMAACRNYEPLEYGRNGEFVRDRTENFVIPLTNSLLEENAPVAPQIDGDVAAATLRGECDELVRSTWDAYLEDNVLGFLDRGIELSLASPGAQAPTSASASAAEDPLPDEIPTEPAHRAGPDPREDPPLLDELGHNDCDDRDTPSPVVPTEGPSLACLSIEQDVQLGQWVTSSPGEDPRDPGDTIACNCSARLQLSADQGSGIRLIDVAEEDLYPTRGFKLTTEIDDPDIWYDAFSRFRVPLTVNDPVRDDRVRGDIVETRAAAEFPVNLSRLPTGLARLNATAFVQDAFTEESGGIVPAVEKKWSLTIVHERSFERGVLAESGGQQALFLAASGPVDPEKTPELHLEDEGTAFTDLTGNEWDKTSSATVTRELPNELVIDGPSQIDGIAELGIRGCAALILAEDSDGEGACWTGSELVVGLPLGQNISPAVEEVTVDGDTIPLEEQTFEAPDVQPTLEGQHPAEYDVDEVGDVTAVPGPRLIERGQRDVDAFTGVTFEGDWARITVRSDGAGVVGFTPTNAFDEKAGTLDIDGTVCAKLRPCNMTASHVDSYPDEVSTSHAVHDHGIAHRELGHGSTDHPHVVVVRPPTVSFGDLEDPSENGALLEEGSLKHDQRRKPGDPSSANEPRAHMLACAELGFSQEEDVRRLLEPGGRLADNTCVTWVEDEELHYLVPLGQRGKTGRIVQLAAHGLNTEGDVLPAPDEPRIFNTYLNPIEPQGQVSVTPAADPSPETEVVLTASSQTLEAPRVEDGESDLHDYWIEARGPDENWTTVADDLGGLPTPSEEVVRDTVNLSDRIPANASESRVEVRAVLQDTSNNTFHTSPTEFLLDRAPPKVTEARVIASEQRSAVLLDLDEDATVRCEPECSMETVEQIPGAEPQITIPPSQISSPGPRQIQLPLIGLQLGPTYNLTLQLVDDRGNLAERIVELDTFSPLELDASPMEGALVNKTVELSWTMNVVGNETLSTRTSAYLFVDGEPCSLLVGSPEVVTESEPTMTTAGPLPIEAGTADAGCPIPEGGVDAELLIYALAPAADAIALDRVPLHVDITPPAVNLTGPDDWVDSSASVQASAEDSLITDLEVFVDGEPADVEGTTANVTIHGEGIHDVVAVAEDAPGNTGTNETTVRIDETSPTLAAEVLGVRGGLALVNASASDELSGIEDLQVVTSQTSGPLVPGIEDESVLLSIPVDESVDELVVRTRDKALNLQDVRLPLDDVPRTDSGDLVGSLELDSPAPDRLQLSFATSKATTPVVLADAGEAHVEELLPEGRDHQVELTGLEPGAEATVTIAVPVEDRLSPAANATFQLEEDHEPPGEVRNLEADGIPGGVELTWQNPTDDVGIREIVVERDGKELARVDGERYIDNTRTHSANAYRVAAVDLAGNRGPWTHVEASPDAELNVVDVNVDADAVKPEDPVTVEATVSKPAGLSIDVVTLSTGDTEIPMHPTDEGPTRASYEVTLRLPALDVVSGDVNLTVTARSGDTVETSTVPAPLVAQSGVERPDEQPQGVPAPGLAGLAAALTIAAAASRRWFH